jgi:hypothetical protein
VEGIQKIQAREMALRKKMILQKQVFERNTGIVYCFFFIGGNKKTMGYSGSSNWKAWYPYYFRNARTGFNPA